jgi:hypothetical protein
MFDLLVAELKDKLVADINDSQLPSTAIAYVIQDISQQLNALVQRNVEAQKQERDKNSIEAALDSVNRDVENAGTDTEPQQ